MHNWDFWYLNWKLEQPKGFFWSTETLLIEHSISVTLHTSYCCGFARLFPSHSSISFRLSKGSLREVTPNSHFFSSAPKSHLQKLSGLSKILTLSGTSMHPTELSKEGHLWHLNCAQLKRVGPSMQLWDQNSSWSTHGAGASSNYFCDP